MRHIRPCMSIDPAVLWSKIQIEPKIFKALVTRGQNHWKCRPLPRPWKRGQPGTVPFSSPENYCNRGTSPSVPWSYIPVCPLSHHLFTKSTFFRGPLNHWLIFSSTACLSDDCLMTARQLPDNCLTTAWQLPDNCLTIWICLKWLQ